MTYSLVGYFLQSQTIFSPYNFKSEAGFNACKENFSSLPNSSITFNMCNTSFILHLLITLHLDLRNNRPNFVLKFCFFINCLNYESLFSIYNRCRPFCISHSFTVAFDTFILPNSSMWSYSLISKWSSSGITGF